MKIQKLIVKNLYGFMNKTISLEKSISILVGMNGSGKTSILNIINWLLKPSMPDLCLMEFDALTLYFKYENKDYSIHCIQNKVELVMELTNLTESRVYGKIQATFRQHPKRLTRGCSELPAYF
jgi:predicted ATP-binding protein involved in virulence